MASNFNAGKVQAEVTSITQAFTTPSTEQTMISKGSANTGVTGDQNVHSVTASKKFYVTNITISPLGGANNFAIYDATSVTGTPKGSLGSGTYSLVLPTPIEFSTAVYIDAANGNAYSWSVTGFEQ